jgi:hypothetical protein
MPAIIPDIFSHEKFARFFAVFNFQRRLPLSIRWTPSKLIQGVKFLPCNQVMTGVL